MNTNYFDTALTQLPNNHPFKDSLIDVLDSADFVHRWMRDRDLSDPQLLLGLTDMVLTHQRLAAFSTEAPTEP